MSEPEITRDDEDTSGHVHKRPAMQDESSDDLGAPRAQDEQDDVEGHIQKRPS
jgi:hypothetical protein